MKKIVVMLMSAMFVGSVAMAADQEAANTEKKDVSTNIITGTKKTKVKKEKKIKGEHGQEAKATVTETTKEHKDGQVEKSVEVDAKSDTGEKK